MSAMFIGSPWRPLLPLPSWDVDDRLQILGLTRSPGVYEPDQNERTAYMNVLMPWRSLLPISYSNLFQRPDRLVFLYLYRSDITASGGGIFDPPIFINPDDPPIFLPRIAIPNRRVLLEDDFVRSNLIARLRQLGFIIIFVPKSVPRDRPLKFF